jgi:sialic acid synthase SpsE
MFHCISSYPAPTEQSNLNNITYLAEKFDVHIGLSDHTTNNIAALTAIGMGAVAIEKHFKLDDEECGPDASFSLDIAQLSSLVIECREAWKAKGKNQLLRAEVEKENMIFRRSLYFVNDLIEGQIISDIDVRRIRPGFGLAPKYLEDVIGKRINKNIERGDPVKWEDLSSDEIK